MELLRKVNEMSDTNATNIAALLTKEDAVAADLQAALAQVVTAVSNGSAEQAATIAELRTELAAAQAAAGNGTPVDLSGAMAKLDELDASAKSILQAAGGTPAPAP